MSAWRSDNVQVSKNPNGRTVSRICEYCAGCVGEEVEPRVSSGSQGIVGLFAAEKPVQMGAKGGGYGASRLNASASGLSETVKCAVQLTVAGRVWSGFGGRFHIQLALLGGITPMPFPPRNIRLWHHHSTFSAAEMSAVWVGRTNRPTSWPLRNSTRVGQSLI